MGLLSHYSLVLRVCLPKLGLGLSLALLRTLARLGRGGLTLLPPRESPATKA